MSDRGNSNSLKLDNESRVAVIGGGPAGSLFSYFLLNTAARVDKVPVLDVYEPRDFLKPGPGGCNMCGGIISESLVQMLAAEGINLPSTVVQRGIESYKMHIAGERAVYIDTPLHEKRIAAVHRGAGPLGSAQSDWESFDGYLLKLAASSGANVHQTRVESIVKNNGRFTVTPKDGEETDYDLVVVATGVNSSAKFHDLLEFKIHPPETTRTFICELPLGKETIQAYFGNSMHVFVVDMPNLEFAALIPKGEFLTLCLLGEGLDRTVLEDFLKLEDVHRCFPPGWELPEKFCRCAPKMNVNGGVGLYSDGIVFVGDSGVCRLFKDGLGSAYRTAKSAAVTAVFEGISSQDFNKHYLPTCRGIMSDNRVGRLLFWINGILQKVPPTRRAVLRMVAGEQQGDCSRQMSGVLWDMFTGSTSYTDVLMRTIRPSFWLRFIGCIFGRDPCPVIRKVKGEAPVKNQALGKVFQDGETIIRQGAQGDCAYVIQSGKVGVYKELNGEEMFLAELGEGEIIGEMALFEQDIRSATIRATGEVRVLSVDKVTLLRRVHEDPSFAFRFLERMSHRLRGMDEELMKMKERLSEAEGRKGPE